MHRKFSHQCTSAFIWLMVLFSSFSVLAQTHVNPFDIPERKGEVNSATILPNDTLIRKAEITTILADTTQRLTLDSVVPQNIPESQVTNPFDVDHRPLKRTEQNSNLSPSNPKNNGFSGFILWILILVSGLLAIILNTHTKYLSMASKGVFNENILKRLNRDDQSKHVGYHFILYTIYVLGITTFFYLILDKIYGLNGLQLYLIILAGVIAVYAIRHLILSALGHIFSISKNTSFYSFLIMLFNQIIGIVLLPINILLAFGPIEVFKIVMIVGFIILLVFYILKSVRGLLSISEFYNERIFQIFIYLCAFEIAPFLILFKYLDNSRLF